MKRYGREEPRLDINEFLSPWISQFCIFYFKEGKIQRLIEPWRVCPAEKERKIEKGPSFSISFSSTNPWLTLFPTLLFPFLVTYCLDWLSFAHKRHQSERQ